MDNVTHSLFGIAVADALTQRRFRHLKAPAIAASLIANNFPDLDFLYARGLSKPFGYILHHRGHTHTLVMAIPQAILIVLCLLWFIRRKGQKFSGSDWGFLGFISVLGICTHIGLDSLNSYGVHPFWPFDNSWYYLDALFILEPFLWLCLGAALALEAQAKWARWVYWGIFLGALGMVSTVSLVPMPMKAFYWGTGIALAALLTKTSAVRRTQVALGCLALFVGAMIFSSNRARQAVEAEARTLAPGENLDSVVLTPNAGNPFCFQVFSISRDLKENLFIIRRGHYSHFVKPSACESTKPTETSMALNKIAAPAEGPFQWDADWKSSLSDLQRMAKGEDCHFAAFLRFSRVPYRLDFAKGESYFGDLRYERGKEKSFASFHITDDMPCPKDLPNWLPPRSKSLMLD